MWRLDAEQGTLRREGEQIVLVPKAAALLRALADRGGQIVTKDELMAAVWPGVTVEEGNLAKLVFMLRKVLGDEAIETASRRGYRLVAAVQVGTPPHEVNAAAYELYVQGRYYWNRRPGAVTFRALECFQKAIEIDPSFARAWAGVADVYATLGSWEAGVLDHAEAHAKAWKHASRALELDPTLVEALTTRAYTTLHFAWDTDAAAERFQHVIASNPSYAPAHHWYSHCLVATGRFEESLAVSRTALALDPMNLLLHVHLAWHFLLAGKHADGLEVATRVVAMDSQFHWAHYFAGWGAEMTGDVGRAVDEMRLAVTCSNDDIVMRAGLGRALAAAGDRAAVQPIIEQLEQSAVEGDNAVGEGRFDYELALIHLALGDRDRAVAALQRAHDARSGWMVYARVDPRLAAIRADERIPPIAPRAL